MRGALLLTLLALAVLAADAHGAVRQCGNVDLSSEASEEGAYDIRATAVSCATARAVARASKHHGPSGEDGREFRYRSRGFTCRGRESATTLPSVRYTCRRGTARVRFDKS
jgi:hypothetical protein